MRFWFRIALPMALASVLLSGCATTDKQSYAAGEVGKTTFHNTLSEDVYLSGCSAYFLEKLEQDVWTDRGPAVVCVWEGFAVPVSPEASESFELVVFEPGLWRLVYPVGLGCDPDQPLESEHCETISEVHTQPFTVQEVCDPDSSCADGD